MGERLVWFRLADRLGVPIQRLQRETTSTEFHDWCSYLSMVSDEELTTTADQYYLAQIASEIRKLLHAQPNIRGKVNGPEMKHFILRVSNRRPQVAETEEALKRRVAMSKAGWLGAVGLDPRLADGRGV
jgi:hypothetical protein